MPFGWDQNPHSDASVGFIYEAFSSRQLAEGSREGPLAGCSTTSKFIFPLRCLSFLKVSLLPVIQNFQAVIKKMDSINKLILPIPHPPTMMSHILIRPKAHTPQPHERLFWKILHMTRKLT